MSATLADAFIAKGRAVARFAPGGDPAARCLSCVRKRYSYPDDCGEGWNRMRALGDAAGAGCANWLGWDADLAGPKPKEKGETP